MNEDRAAAIDLARAPRGELAAAHLVTAVADTGDLAERHYLELKGPPDLATKVNKAKVAKFILGAANRLPDRAAEAFEGYGVMIVGITKQGIEGVPPIEMLALSQVIQPFLGAAGDEMQMAAHAPQKFVAAFEEFQFLRREQSGADQFLDVAHAIDVFADPEERVEVAQPPLAFLDIGFDEIARRAGAGHALVALGKLGGDEFARRAAHDFLLETIPHFLEKRLLAEDEARFQQGRADGHVAVRLPQAFVDRACGMPDLLLEVPEDVERRLDDAFAPAGLLRRKQEQQVDVGPRRQRAASIAADRADRHALGDRGILDRVDVAGHAIVDGADQLVFEIAEEARAGQATAAGFQHLAGARMAVGQRLLEMRHDRLAEFVPRSDRRRQVRDGLGERRPVDRRAGMAPPVPGGPTGGLDALVHRLCLSQMPGRAPRGLRVPRDPASWPRSRPRWRRRDWARRPARSRGRPSAKSR